MTRSMTVAAAACALAATTCFCPSLFLTVTKGNPSPRSATPAPIVAAVPFEVPPALDNRFDVLSRTARPADYEAFDDRAVGARSISSAKALFRIQEDFGTDAPALTNQDRLELDACIACTTRTCETLVVGSQYPFSADDHPFISFPDELGDRLVRAIQTLEAAEPGAAGFLQKCEPKPGDKLVLLASPLAAVESGRRVKVQAARLVMSEPIAAFVHVSDVQIRDPDIRVGDRILSHHLDKLISSFEYDNDLELYNRHVVEAVFATINKMRTATPDPPTFVVHTGDAVDSGVTTELREFHRLFDTLDIPAYDVLGNHDVLVFGNLLVTDSDRDRTCTTAESQALSGSEKVKPLGFLLPNRICIKRDIECKSCLPGEAKLIAGTTHALSHVNFMSEFKRHSDADALAEPPARDVKNPQIAAEGPVYCPAMVDGKGQVLEREIRVQTTTLQHGFDLNKVPGKEPPGYYAFANDITVAGAHLHALYIALDTNDLDEHEGGTLGRVNTTQLAWLRHTLACVGASHPDDLVFVFGHHGLGETEPPRGSSESLEHVLSTSDNVVAYFYGHEHDHGICRPAGSCAHFWEVMTGSIIEVPQEARLVRVKYAGRGLGFLEVVTFGERIENTNDALAKAVALGHRGAERDYCANHRADECSDDKRPYRDDGRHTSARLFFRLPQYKDKHLRPLPRR